MNVVFFLQKSSPCPPKDTKNAYSKRLSDPDILQFGINDSFYLLRSERERKITVESGY